MRSQIVLKKAAKSLKMNKTADKIASAIATESVPDPKIVQVMIKGALDLKFKEAKIDKEKRTKSSKQPQQQK